MLLLCSANRRAACLKGGGYGLAEHFFQEARTLKQGAFSNLISRAVEHKGHKFYIADGSFVLNFILNVVPLSTSLSADISPPMVSTWVLVKNRPTPFASLCR
jgi:hypothetical protein